MRLDCCFVNVYTPTRPVGDYEMTGYNFGRVDIFIIFPGHVIDVDLHDAEIGYSRAKMRAHHGA